MRATLPALSSFAFRPFTFVLRKADRAERDEQRTLEAEVAAARLVPLVERVRVAGGAARADGDGGQAARDGDVRVGRGAVEEGLRAERARRLDGEAHERRRGRRRAAGPV